MMCKVRSGLSVESVCGVGVQGEKDVEGVLMMMRFPTANDKREGRKAGSVCVWNINGGRWR